MQKLCPLTRRVGSVSIGLIQGIVILFWLGVIRGRLRKRLPFGLRGDAAVHLDWSTEDSWEDRTMQSREAGHPNFMYPVKLDVRYTIRSRALGVLATGSGHTSSIGSHHIIFTGDQPIPKGARVEVSVAWPALLENRVKLQLILQGRTAAADGARTTVAISHYEFRTRALEPAHAILSMASPVEARQRFGLAHA